MTTRPLWIVATAVVLFGVVMGGLAYRSLRASRLVALRQACLAARNTSDWPRMERLAARWRIDAPLDPDAWICAAQASLEQGRLDEAASLLDRLPDGEPKTVLGLLKRVDLLVGPLRDPIAAIETCERIIAMAPTAAEAHRRLLFLRAVLLDRRNLAADARRAIQCRADLPDTHVYLLASSWITLSDTSEMNGRWLTQHPDEETFLVAKARGDVVTRGLDGPAEDDSVTELPAAESENERRLRALLERFPHNTELLTYFLERATVAGNVKEAVTLLGAAGPNAEADGRFWRFKGWVHAARDEIDLAESSYRRAIALDPFDFASRHLLAAALRKKGDAQEASALSRIADKGRALRRTILQQPNAAATPPDVLRRIADYAADCGENEVARAILDRIEADL